MKKIFILLCLSCPVSAGTIGIYGTNMTATISSGTASSGGGSFTLTITSQTYSGAGVQSWTMNCQGGNFLVCEYIMPTAGTVATGMTYNGVAMTYSTQTVNGTGPDTVGFYYLASPAAGANTVAITGIAGATVGGCVSFSDGRTPTYDASSAICSTAGGGTGTATMNVTTAVSNEYIVDVIYNNGGGANTASGSQVLQWTGGTGIAGFASGGGSSLSVPAAGTNAMAWTATSFSQPVHCAIAVEP